MAWPQLHPELTADQGGWPAERPAISPRSARSVRTSELRSAYTGARTRGQQGLMAAPVKPRFDPKAFLATVARGRTVSKYAKDAIVYRQAGPADAVHYV